MPTESEIRPECLTRLRDLEARVFKGNGQPSHAERLAALERAVSTQTWLLRAILTATLGNLAGVLFALLRK